MNDTPTPGWKSSEWWTTLVHVALSLLVTLGVVKSADLSALDGALTAAVTAAFAFASATWVVVTYVKGRVALKTVYAASRGLRK